MDIRTNSRFINGIQEHKPFAETFRMRQADKSIWDNAVAQATNPSFVPATPAARHASVPPQFERLIRANSGEAVDNDISQPGESTWINTQNGFREIKYNTDGSVASLYVYDGEKNTQYTFNQDGSYNMELLGQGKVLEKEFFDSEGVIRQHTIYTDNGKIDKSYKDGELNIMVTIDNSDRILEYTRLVQDGRFARDIFNPETGIRTERIVYDADGEIQMTLQCDENGSFTDTPNGKVDKVVSQRSGTCWLTGSIVSLDNTPGGERLLDRCLQIDEETGNATVTLKGAPGQPNPNDPDGLYRYTFTPQELRAASHLSEGDYDVRALELGFERYFQEEKPYSDRDNVSNGGQMKWAYEVITGQQTREANQMTDLSTIPAGVPVEYQFQNGDNGSKIFDYLEKTLPNVAITTGAQYDVASGHAYVINSIEGDNLYITESNNTGNEIVMTRQEFMDNFSNQIYSSPFGNSVVVRTSLTFIVLPEQQ